MTISSTLSTDGKSMTIAIDGRFDFSEHQTFRRAYENCDAEPESYTLDMRDTSYLDSSALGMLLLLRDYAGGDNAKICIVNASDEVKKILSISNFEQLLTIQ